jgi:hypothetical protein
MPHILRVNPGIHKMIMKRLHDQKERAI